MGCSKMKKTTRILNNAIKSVAKNKENFVLNPYKDFTRERIFGFEKTLTFVIGLNKDSLKNNIADLQKDELKLGTESAFIQSRDKILPSAFHQILKNTISQIILKNEYDGLKLLAIDGSSFQIPINTGDTDSYIKSTYSSDGNLIKGHNELHLNAIYDLNAGYFEDIIIQKIHKTNEQKAFCDLVDDRKEKPYSTLLIADRGYASWNNLAHVVQKQQYFLIRIKDGYGGIKRGLNLPSEDEYDCFFEINLCRGQTNEDKKRYEDKNHYKFLPVGVRFDFLPKKRQKNKPSQQYKINFRVVRFKIGDGSYESVLTNLPQAKYSITTIKYLYNKRWGIETAYRSLKYTVGLSHLHCKSITGILQEIYAKVIIYNLAQSLISEIVVSKKSNNKYLYKPNFSVAIHQEILLLRGETKLKLVIRTISKDLIPIRPNRSFKRNKQVRRFKGFHYRAG